MAKSCASPGARSNASSSARRCSDDERGEEAAVDPARDVVPRRDRHERTRVVVESDGVVEARRLGRLLAEPQHALRAVVEPPRRTQLQRRIVARQRRQFARVDGLVEREQDDRQRGLVAEAVEQRSQRAHVVGPGGDVRPLVAAEAAHHERIVIAQAARVNLHDEAVVDAHRGHLGQDLATERLGLGGGDGAGKRAIEETLALGRRKIAGLGRGVAVVGRRRAHRPEVRAAVAVRGEVACPGRRVLAGDGAELRDVAGEALELGIRDRIRAVRGDDASLPAGLPDLPVMVERIERRFGRRDHFDVETLEQRARTELGRREARVDPVEAAVRRLGRQPFVDAEHRRERVVEPHARGRAAEQVKVFGERVPYPARVRRDRTAIVARNAQVLESYALAVEHPEHVVVRRDEQRRGVGERRVVGEPLRIGVAVRTDDGQILHRRVQAARESADRRVGGEQPVGIQVERNGHVGVLENDGGSLSCKSRFPAMRRGRG